MSTSDGSIPQAQRHRVMFVCLGNICRSPAAQAVMQSLVDRMGLSDHFVIDSSGTASYHIGRPPDARMIAAGSKRGLEFKSLAKALTPELILGRDLVVAMDRENATDIQRIAGDTSRPNNMVLLSDFLSEEWPRNVPDPYYGEAAGFEYVLDMLEAACPKIIERIRTKPYDVSV